MQLITHIATVLYFLTSSVHALAAPRAFQIVTTKQITSNVDRFYGADENAFATVFCNDQTAQVMFVDSRYPDLDGKVFFFGSQDACQKARKTARDMSKICLTQLLLEQDTKGAVVQASQCK